MVWFHKFGVVDLVWKVQLFCLIGFAKLSTAGINYQSLSLQKQAVAVGIITILQPSRLPISNNLV